MHEVRLGVLCLEPIVDSRIPVEQSFLTLVVENDDRPTEVLRFVSFVTDGKL
jgi:hypothetical protein